MKVANSIANLKINKRLTNPAHWKHTTQMSIKRKHYVTTPNEKFYTCAKTSKQIRHNLITMRCLKLNTALAIAPFANTEIVASMHKTPIAPP